MDLRCTCSARPLLAKALPVDGRWVLHVKIYKRGALYGELIAESGVIRIRCRACLRWYSVRIKHQVTHTPEELPVGIAAAAGKS